METPVRVLLVDDEPGIRRVLGALIKDFGYDVLAVESAREALDAFTDNPFPLVVTDIRMPGMDGLALLERVRSRNADTQVIMITGHGDMDIAVECLRLGAADFITKPVNDDMLEHALNRAAEQHSLREQLRQHTEHLEERGSCSKPTGSPSWAKPWPVWPTPSRTSPPRWKAACSC